MDLKNINKINETYDKLKNYCGPNSYMIELKNKVFAYGQTLSSLQMEYIEMNIDFEPKYIGKIVHISRWWGEKKQLDWNTPFVPEKLFITWYLGETTNAYVFYAQYRQSQPQAQLIFAPKQAIWENFFIEDFNSIDINFSKYVGSDGRTLRPHQEDAVKFLVSRQRAILADSMGLGKTVSAIVSSIESQYKRILIICPASVKTTWNYELSLFVPQENIEVVNGSKWKDAKYTILNFDILDNFYNVPTETYQTYINDIDNNGKIVKVKDKVKEKVSKKNDVIFDALKDSQLYQSHFDLIIIDEAHKLSNNTSGRYKICDDLIKRSNPRGLYIMTGTPITNNTKNLYNILKLLRDPITSDYAWYMQEFCGGKQIYCNKGQRDKFTNIFLSKKKKTSWYDLDSNEKEELTQFLDRYCKKIWLANGNTNLEELSLRIKHLYLRRIKEDLDSIVKKYTYTNKYALTTQERAEYDDIWNNYLKSQNGKKDLELLMKNRNMTEGIFLRQWLSKRMIPHTIDLVKEIIDRGEKAIVFCAFDEEINTLKEIFGDIAVMHNGKMNIKKKKESVDQFQQNPNIKIFLGNIISAGVGLTLTAANNVVFNNFDWVPGNGKQAEDRAHRLNQTKDVNIYYQVFENTFYEEMLDKVNEKQEVIDKVIITENNK